MMAGTPIPEVSAMLGHSNVNITLTVYTHFIPKMQTDSSARLASAIFSGKNRLATKLDTLRTLTAKKQ
jgi:integrase